MAEKLVNRINPPFTESAREDPYGQSWEPYKENSSRVTLVDNVETVEEVFNTALTLSEDILEKEGEIRDD